MERLTEQKRNGDGTGGSKQSLIDRFGKGDPSSYCHRIVTKLAEYEDLEEQGKLLKLPCAMGDTVYWVNNWFVGYASGIIDNEWYITKSDVSRFFCNELGLFVKLKNGENISTLEFEKTLFLTKEEAEVKLKINKCIYVMNGMISEMKL